MIIIAHFQTQIIIMMAYGRISNETDRAKASKQLVYLPGSEDTLISKEVPPGRGPSIAPRLG